MQSNLLASNREEHAVSYLSFSTWFISLSIISSRLTHIASNDCILSNVLEGKRESERQRHAPPKGSHTVILSQTAHVYPEGIGPPRKHVIFMASSTVEPCASTTPITVAHGAHHFLWLNNTPLCI